MPAMSRPQEALQTVLEAMKRAARDAERPEARLLAVSKMQPAEAVAALAGSGQSAFGENYVHEATAKIAKLAELGAAGLEWHLIGHLQSNKCREAAENFDWVQSLDREKLVEALNRFRPATLPPLNVLIQVNVDGEVGKSGCAPMAIAMLAESVARAPRLLLRGLMAIPEPSPDIEQRRCGFQAMLGYFDSLRAQWSSVDTLSMGMSEDFAVAIAEGATMVRVGSALFGPRR